MTECWAEGDLRAYLDRELDAAEMDRLAGHLRMCLACSARYEDISGRAARVADWMSTAPAAAKPSPRTWWSVWGRPAAAIALAASLALAIVTVPKGPVPVAHRDISQGFIALDDDPIDTGLVVRVALGPDEVQADVIFSPDGRARAFRLVDRKSNN